MLNSTRGLEICKGELRAGSSSNECFYVVVYSKIISLRIKKVSSKCIFEIVISVLVIVFNLQADFQL